MENILKIVLNNEKFIDALYNKFEKDINSFIDEPCSNPYDLSSYNDKKTINVLKEIDEKRNHSWIKELYCRNNKSLNQIAIVYRGQKFTYKEFFAVSYLVASSLKSKGFIKNQEFVCAIENTPMFPFIMGATSIIGGRVNLTSAEMDKDYLVNMVNKAEFPFVFVSDMSFEKFSPVLNECKKGVNVVPIPLDYSLKNGNKYKEIIDRFYKLDSEKYEIALKNANNVNDINDFLLSGINYFELNKNISEKTGLNDNFTTTYTSGSTGWGRPKALVHRNRSYITMGRYHDSIISGIPSMKGKITMALCKTMSDTDFMSNISDTLMQGGTLALEPINDKEFFIPSLLINKPNLAICSRSYWIYAMKETINNPLYQNIKLPFLLVPTSAGEPVSAGEEKALNKWLKKVDAGVEFTKVPFSTLSVAGGDSEHGGIFLALFRALQSKKISHIGIKEPIGMTTYDMVDIKALRPDGTYCDIMEPGQLVANSPCTMEGYVENFKANNEFFIQDAYGKKWANLNTYGYIDNKRKIYVKGRISKTDSNIPNYVIQDIISKDTKKIMSCEVVNFNYENDNVYVAHIEPQIGTSFNVEKVLLSAKQRISKELGEDILDNIYFRIHYNDDSFKLLHTGKRNVIELVNEGISEKCISANFNNKKTC